jgi:putative transposase
MFKTIDEYCFKSKNLYNYATYLVRQKFITNGSWLRYSKLDPILQKEDVYKECGSQAAQIISLTIDDVWKSYFKSIKDWKKHPEKYLGMPRLPKYKKKDGRFIYSLKNIQYKIDENGFVYFSFKPFKKFNNLFKANASVGNKLNRFNFVPCGSHYVMNILYEIEVPDTVEESKQIIGIDLGVDNLATISNNIGVQPIIINGRPIKSINQYYNKKLALLRSEVKKKCNKDWSKSLQKVSDKRNRKVNYYLHKASKKVINYCLENQIDTIVIGLNKTWKQEADMIKKNNQKFVYIPYDKLIKLISYKGENVGIKVITNGESYTSGTSFLDREYQ